MECHKKDHIQKAFKRDIAVKVLTSALIIAGVSISSLLSQQGVINDRMEMFGPLFIIIAFIVGAVSYKGQRKEYHNFRFRLQLKSNAGMSAEEFEKKLSSINREDSACRFVNGSVALATAIAFLIQIIPGSSTGPSYVAMSVLGPLSLYHAYQVFTASDWVGTRREMLKAVYASTKNS